MYEICKSMLNICGSRSWTICVDTLYL